MAKVQIYVSNEVVNKINAIVEKDVQRGAHEKDVSLSSVVSMLLELAFRVYEAQIERKETGFNQMAFNAIYTFPFVGGAFTIAMLILLEKYELSYQRGNVFFIGAIIYFFGLIGHTVFGSKTFSLDELEIGRHWKNDCNFIEVNIPTGTLQTLIITLTAPA